MKHYVRESWRIGKNARYVRYYKPGEYAVITVLSYIFAGILLVPLMLTLRYMDVQTAADVNIKQSVYINMMQGRIRL